MALMPGLMVADGYFDELQLAVADGYPQGDLLALAA
jgi:hypothetical protein